MERTISRSGLGRVFITGMYRSIGRVEFPKVLLNEKGPIAAYENESIWSAILPRPTIMTIVLFCDDWEWQKNVWLHFLLRR